MQLVYKIVLWSGLILSSLGASAFSNGLDLSKLNIEDSVSQALHSHPRLFQSLRRIAEQQAQLSYVEAGLLPSISLSAGIGREDSNNSSTRALNGMGSEEMERREAGITVSQRLFDGFRQDNLRKAQVERLSSEQWLHLNLVSELAMKAAEAHLELAFSEQDLGDALSNLKVHEQIAKDVGLRVRSGKDDRARVSQISARLSLALANVESAKNRVLLAKSAYQREIGSLPSGELNVAPVKSGLPESEGHLLEVVFEGNSYYLAQQQQFEASKLDAFASMGGRYPELYLDAGASWNNNIDGVQGRNNDAYVMFRMQYDLYKGGADKAQERLAKSRKETQRYVLEDLKRDLNNESVMAWLNYNSTKKRLVFLKDYVASAETTKAAYAQQFHIGQRSLIDLLDAENELLRAKNEFSEAQKHSVLSAYMMLHLQGKLLSEFELVAKVSGDE